MNSTPRNCNIFSIFSSLKEWPTGSFYLTALTVVYLFAFYSLYIQYPGLYGEHGLMPISTFAKRVASDPKEGFAKLPSLMWFHKELGFEDIGLLGEGICLCGIVLSAIMFVVPYWSVSGFILLWFGYLSLFQMGQTFLSFQWDILLLEAGFASIFFVPFIFKRKNDSKIPFPSPATWVLRWLLFKLMLMSGVVKIQADCPTWINLTALEYHFATQCIPTPLAWVAHQAPPLIQRLSVAATLVIEIPAPLLLIMPWTVARRFGVVLQVLLQVPIILTGNYGFFNLLTLVLCIPAWDGGSCTEDINLAIQSDHEKFTGLFKMEVIDQLGLINWIAGLVVCLRKKIGGNKINTVIWLLILGLMCWVCQKMFIIEVLHDKKMASIWGGKYHIQLLLTKDSLEALVSKVLPHIFMTFGLLMIVSSCKYAIDTVNNAVNTVQPGMLFGARKGFSAGFAACRSLGLGSILFIIFCVSCVPFTSLHPDLQNNIPRAVGYVFQASQNWRLTSGYGLFRKMTGVGATPKKWKRKGKQIWGVGGLPPSIVQRPEILLEGSSDGGNTWKEIQFLYKPGRANKSPVFIAPHQPRLDWQMWFAALGPYQGAPWFIHLLDKIFEGCTPVLNLLDQEVYPFKEDPPTLLRSSLFHYDFTRANTSWNKAIPATRILPKASPEWWNITKVSDYTPVINAKNPSVLEFMGHYGWSRRPCGMVGCSDDGQKGSVLACRLLTSVRNFRILSRPSSLNFLGMVLIILLVVDFLYVLVFLVPFKILLE